LRQKSSEFLAVYLGTNQVCL